MASATADQVRRRVGDTDSESQIFDDDAVSEAITDALDYLIKKNITPESPIEIRLHSYVAADYLLMDKLDALGASRAVQSMSEQGSSVQFVDLEQRQDKIRTRINQLMFEIQGSYYETGDVGAYQPELI